jgi:hypothetical protein
MSQELEPRAYANVPVGSTAVALVYGYSRGNVLTDPAKPIEGAKLQAHNIGVGYVRTFSLFNKLSRIQFTWPASFLIGKATVNGNDTSITRNGFGDARFRFGINLLGSPALTPKEFRTYEQKTIFGVSFITSIPVGNYYKDKLVNLGSNRWAFKPEIGISRRFEHVYAEAYAGVWFYTKNSSYLVNKIQRQQPVFSFQGHFSYYFKNQMWLGVNGTWFSGGKTFIDDVPAGNLENNWRVGATWSFQLVKQQSLKLQYHVGAFTSSGYDYNMLSLTYQYLFLRKAKRGVN